MDPEQKVLQLIKEVITVANEIWAIGIYIHGRTIINLDGNISEMVNRSIIMLNFNGLHITDYLILSYDQLTEMVGSQLSVQPLEKHRSAVEYIQSVV